MKTPKYYIVQEKTSEYNDETYDLRDGGTPVRVFADKEKAVAHMEKLDFKSLSSLAIFEYGYESDEIVRDIQAFNTALSKITGKEENIDEDDLFEWTLPKMTFAQFKSIRRYIKLNMYEVIECEGEI